MLKFEARNGRATANNGYSMEQLVAYSILVVDDEPMARNLLRLMLVRDGFDVIEAADGQDALAVLERHRPDLIVLDVMMPGLDGMALCKSLQARSEMQGVPIIMLSARTDADSIQQGYASGAARYLSKPISAEVLTSHVRDLLTTSTTST